METPRLSFIMPAWKAAHLHAAIESIVAQDCGDWELVVVDDCSPEDLGSIVASFPDSRIRYVRNDSNIGGSDLVAQWNHCLEFARAEYLALAADDDLYAPEFCGECLRLAQKYPSVDVVRSAVEQIDDNDAHVWDDSILPEFTDSREFFHLWVSGKVFSCIGNFMFRKSALDRIGGFMSFPCAFGSDIATPIELSGNGVANTQEMLFKFRQGADHLSADTSRYGEKLQAISELSVFLDDKNSTLGAVDKEYLYRKCMYDYFNLVVGNLPAGKLGLIRNCTRAGGRDKAMLLLRWIKKRITGK